jgi:hypothetical protein
MAWVERRSSAFRVRLRLVGCKYSAKQVTWASFAALLARGPGS